MLPSMFADRYCSILHKFLDASSSWVRFMVIRRFNIPYSVWVFLRRFARLWITTSSTESCSRWKVMTFKYNMVHFLLPHSVCFDLSSTVSVSLCLAGRFYCILPTFCVRCLYYYVFARFILSLSNNGTRPTSKWKNLVAYFGDDGDGREPSDGHPGQVSWMITADDSNPQPPCLFPRHCADCHLPALAARNL